MTRLAVECLALATCVALAEPTARAHEGSTQGDTSVSVVLADARAYLEKYKEELTFLIAEEQYVQEIRYQTPVDKRMPQSRTMRSEIYFISLPSSSDWMAIRDVQSVDGKTVTDKPNVPNMLATSPAAQVEASLKAYNARYNIGRTIRNFNEPTLSLLILQPQRASSVTFEMKGIATSPGAQVATLAFREVGPETVLRDLSLKPVLSEGELLVEVGTGRIRRAQLKAKLGTVKVEFTTTYVQDATLHALVPAVFREQYEDGLYHANARNEPGNVEPYEQIVCEAKYSHFRRFEVTGHIKGLNGSDLTGLHREDEDVILLQLDRRNWQPALRKHLIRSTSVRHSTSGGSSRSLGRGRAIPTARILALSDSCPRPH